MDLNEKLAQRRKEREQESAVVQAEIAATETAKTEFVKQEARKQLADAGLQQVNDSDTEKEIQKEKEKIIEKMALSRWTSTENFIGFLLFLFVILAFFKNLILGFLMLIVSVVYYDGKNKKYKKQIEIEIKQIKDFQGDL